MFSHVMVGSNDIERSKRFYDAVLGALGVGEPRSIWQAPATLVSSTDMTAEPSASANPSTVSRQPLPTEEPSASNAIRLSKCVSSMT